LHQVSRTVEHLYDSIKKEHAGALGSGKNLLRKEREKSLPVLLALGIFLKKGTKTG
jgi:hypothetical protein